MVRSEKTKRVGKEDVRAALIHFFQMKLRKNVSGEWKRKEVFNLETMKPMNQFQKSVHCHIKFRTIDRNKV